MGSLNNWLQQATRALAEDAAEQVRAEIQEHYQLAHEAAIADSATAEEADGLALKALGDARATNRQYRRVLLTAAEARTLRDIKSQASPPYSDRWSKRLRDFDIVIAGLLFLTGHTDDARAMLVMGLGLHLLIMAPHLPIYTPRWGRVFRFVKWLAMAGSCVPAILQGSWLCTPCLLPLISTEWTRAAIRRKLPVDAWPKHLYL